MKTNFKRIGKQSISIVLAVMMMLSTMLVGMVTSNAADTFTNGSTLYFDTKAINQGNERWAAYFFNIDSENDYVWKDCTAVPNNDKIYSVTVPGSYANVVFCRMNKDQAENVLANMWNKSYNLKASEATGNEYVSTGWVSNTEYFTGEWGTYADHNTTENDYDFYVTGYMNGNNLTTSNNYKFTKESNGIYTCTMTPTGDLYVTITDKNSGKEYWSASYEKLSENTDSTKTVVTSGGDKWGILGQAGKEIKITFDITAGISNGKIRWESAAAQYKIDVDKNITNGTVTPSATSLAAGEKFTVEATPNVGYELETVTVKDAKGNSVPATNESTHTYTMPESNVTVSATFKVKTDARFSVTYTRPTGDGVVSASIDPTETTLAAGLTEGTTVTVTVTVKDGYTVSLAVDGVNVTPSKNGNIYTFTFLMPAQNITVAPQVTKAEENTGTEIQGLYLIYTTENDGNPTNFKQFLNLYYDSNNQVYAYFKDTELDTSKNYKFMISTLKGENSFEGTTNYNKDNYVNVTTTDSNSIDVGHNDYNVGSNKYIYGWFSVKNPSQSTVSSVKINLGYYNNGKIQENANDTSYTHSYEVIPTISGAVEGMPQVFAKDGTIRATYQKYADMADTVFTAENNDDLTGYVKKDYYDTASAKVGTKLKITTTIDDKYKDTYFVKAFSINGYSYGIIDASQAKEQNGVYTCEYTIPEDFEGKRIEITPIYYYIEEKDTVTFYVEGFDAKVQEMWGNTIAVQAWYANGEEKEQFEKAEFSSPTKNALGGYPGQPLVYQGGKYSMQIPKHLNGNENYTVKGITLNNYFWDEIHQQSEKSNCQTYDYNDFYKLSETPDVDNIIFDFRYRTTTDEDKDGNKPKEDLNSSTYSKTELELLKDYSGNIVDIFGNILSKDLADDYENNHLTVISNGYVSITGIGKYATEWSVYDSKGNYITKINCSSLINENNVDPTYTKDYSKLKQYKNLPVMIAYEKSLYGGDDLGTRADGRWYFSKKADTITANVKIEYKADGTSKFVEDVFGEGSNVGVNTKAQAYFTNAGSIGKTTCDGTVDGGNFSVHAETDANAKYYFLGWYLKTSDGYSFITNESDADFPMTNNETYVARFINTPSGTLTLSHTLLGDSAYGKTFIKADIVDSEGNVIKPFDEISGNIVIPSSYVNYASEYKIVATLKTVPYGKDEVEGFYNSDKKRYDYAVSGTGEKTYEVSTTIKDLFEEINNDDGSVSHKLIKSNIPFYSKITSVPISYQITYTYDTRLDDKKSYVIKDTVSGIELEQMWAENETAKLPNKEQLSKAFIIRKAPFVSNFREKITWNMDKATINDYNATVLATTEPVKLNISALTVAGSWTAPAPVEYGELAKSNGDYLYKTGTTEFPDTIKYLTADDAPKYDFSFWAIFNNKAEAEKYSNAVKAYMSGNPAADMSQRLTKLTNLEGYKNLITKSYSKKYNYVSYQDYYIVPVYAGRFAKDDIKEAQVSIRLLEYTRNQWTDVTYGVNGNGIKNEGGSKFDYLYTDFALSFDKDQLLIKDNTDIKVGVAFEIVAKYDPVKPLDSYLTDSNPDEIRNLVKTATVNNKDNGKVGTYKVDSESADRSVYRYQIDNTKISEKNRIEYYLRFNNTKNAQQNVMKVYSYIYDTVSGEVFLSDPEYMNMYDIGNLTYITSGLASNDLQPATEIG